MAWTAWTERLTGNARAIANGVGQGVEQPSKQLNHDIQDGSNGNGGAGISFLSLRPKGDGDHQGAHSDEAVQNPEDVPVLPVACCPLPLPLHICTWRALAQTPAPARMENGSQAVPPRGGRRLGEQG